MGRPRVQTCKSSGRSFQSEQFIRQNFGSSPKFWWIPIATVIYCYIGRCGITGILPLQIEKSCAAEAIWALF
jgi:hypothetical protein